VSSSTDPESPQTESDERRSRTGGPLALTAVTLGLITWPIAFNLGAYGEVFYTDVFRVVVASTILFAITCFAPVYPTPWIWLVRAALIAPMLWLLTAAWLEGSTSAALDRPLFAIWIVIILLVSVPITLRLLIDMFMPELSGAASRRMLWSIIGLAVVVGGAGFVVGRENDRFLTCGDFSVAGSAEPDNCAASDS
jgi:hypothetical protein